MDKTRSTIREYLEALLIAGVFLIFANTFVIQTFFIPSGSMEKTLLIGDHLFVNRFIFGPAATELEKKLLPLRKTERGDIVVFRSPETPKVNVVKRCVGKAGDKIQTKAKQLYINDQPVDDASYAIHTDPLLFPDLPFVDSRGRRRDNFGPFVVPANSYFCMGDNRDFSYDSRYWGPLPEHLMKGRPLFIYWSYGGGTPNGQEQIATRLRQLLGTALGFFKNTRWERTFHLIR
jgi:signal peptidase I